MQGGGNVANALTAAARLGLDCRIFTKASQVFSIVALILCLCDTCSTLLFILSLHAHVIHFDKQDESRCPIKRDVSSNIHVQFISVAYLAVI